MPTASIEEILATIHPRAPRSRLEPYRELIEELRRRRVTFREIADILADRCGVRVTRAAVHGFLRARNRPPQARLAKPAGKSTASPQSLSIEQGIQFYFDPTLPLTLGVRDKKL